MKTPSLHSSDKLRVMYCTCVHDVFQHNQVYEQEFTKVNIIV